MAAMEVYPEFWHMLVQHRSNSRLAGIKTVPAQFRPAQSGQMSRLSETRDTPRRFCRPGVLRKYNISAGHSGLMRHPWTAAQYAVIPGSCGAAR